MASARQTLEVAKKATPKFRFSRYRTVKRIEAEALRQYF